MLVFVSGCLGSGQTEGRAAALLDASEAPARAHAVALAGDNMTEARQTGAVVLAILAEWYRND